MLRVFPLFLFRWGCESCTSCLWNRVWVSDELVEATYNWYAQDTDGNVWYFGRDSEEYEDGEIATE